MFKRIQNKTSRNINVVKIDNTDLRNLGLYLEEDFKLSYIQEKEVKERIIPARDMPHYKTIRSLPIELEITFNVKESTDFYARMDNIKSFLESKKEKIIAFNDENKGFKLYWYSIGDVTRAKGLSTVSITFRCYPDIVSITN